MIQPQHRASRKPIIAYINQRTAETGDTRHTLAHMGRELVNARSQLRISQQTELGRIATRNAAYAEQRQRANNRLATAMQRALAELAPDHPAHAILQAALHPAPAAA
jgi:succinyl-CoA synthetase alpha subunit